MPTEHWTTILSTASFGHLEMFQKFLFLSKQQYSVLRHPVATQDQLSEHGWFWAARCCCRQQAVWIGRAGAELCHRQWPPACAVGCSSPGLMPAGAAFSAVSLNITMDIFIPVLSTCGYLEKPAPYLPTKIIDT